MANNVIRHVPGVWKAIWSDKFIESTVMRYDHVKRCIIGVKYESYGLGVFKRK